MLHQHPSPPQHTRGCWRQHGWSAHIDLRKEGHRGADGERRSQLGAEQQPPGIPCLHQQLIYFGRCMFLAHSSLGGCSSCTSGAGKHSGCALFFSCGRSLDLEYSCIAMHGRRQACKEIPSVRGSGMCEAERLAPTLLPFSTAVMMLLISSSTLRVPRIRSSTLRA